MALIIDGHNLIPHIPGLSLADPDDEQQLIHLLQTYCRLRRTRVDVYFDQAPPGWAGIRSYGQVRAHFVRAGITADAAIMAHLTKLGKRAKNETVVSSDRQVQAAARGAQAKIITAEEFAADCARLADEAPELDPRDRQLSEEEIKDWQQLFKRGHPPASGEE